MRYDRTRNDRRHGRGEKVQEKDRDYTVGKVDGKKGRKFSRGSNEWQERGTAHSGIQISPVGSWRRVGGGEGNGNGMRFRV